MSKRLYRARERMLSTDAIVRERLTGGEDAVLDLLFGPVLVLPKNWRRKRFPYGSPVVDPARSQLRREIYERGERERREREAEHHRQLEAERMKAEKLKWPHRGSGLYTCPRCGLSQHAPEDPPPKWGTMVQCPRCFQVQQFQVYGMHPYDWLALSNWRRDSFKTPPPDDC